MADRRRPSPSLLEYGVLPGQASRNDAIPTAVPGLLEVVRRTTRLLPTSISRAFMAEPETATLAVASLPSSDDLERANSFAREPFLLEGEDAATALAPGTPRRRALDSVLAELDEGHKVPSTTLAPPLVAAAGPRPPALPGRAGAGRRHRAVGPPGRRAVRHADRAAGRGAAQRQRASPTAPSPTSRSSSPPRACPARRSSRRSCARRRTATRIPSTGRIPTRRSPRTSTTPTPPSASGSSTPPAPARPSPRSASSRRRGPAAS